MSLEPSSTEALETNLLERQNEVVRRLEARANERRGVKKENTQQEMVVEYLASFHKANQDIMQALESLPSTEASDLTTFFDEISQKISCLNKAFSQACIYLPTYDQRQIKLALESLTQNAASVRLKAIPKPKFAFNRKERKVAKVVRKETHDAISVDQDIRDESQLDIKVPGNNAQMFVDVNAWQLHDRSDEFVVVPVEASDLYLHKLTRCTIVARHSLSALRVRDLTNCRIILGPINGSVHVEKASGTMFMLAARQVRIHDSTHCEFAVCVRSGPIIETSTALIFSRYRLVYPGLSDQMVSVGFDSTSLEWQDVKPSYFADKYAIPFYVFRTLVGYDLSSRRTGV